MIQQQGQAPNYQEILRRMGERMDQARSFEDWTAPLVAAGADPEGLRDYWNKERVRQPKGFTSAFGEVGLLSSRGVLGFRFPWLADLAEGADLWALRKASMAMQEGVATEADKQLVIGWLVEQSRKPTWGYMAGSILSAAPAFITEIGATGGIYNTVKEGVEKGAFKLLGKSVAEGIEKTLAGSIRTAAAKAIGSKVGSTAIASAATMIHPSVLPLVARESVRAALPEMGLSEDETGQMSVVFGKTAPSFVEAIPKGAYRAFVEHFSERTGELMALPGFMASVFGKLVPKGEAMNWVQKIAKAGRWDGFFREMGEERVADAMLAAIGDKSWSQVVAPGWEQLAGEAAGFAAVGGALRAGEELAGPKAPEPGKVSAVEAAVTEARKDYEKALAKAKEPPKPGQQRTREETDRLRKGEEEARARVEAAERMARGVGSGRTAEPPVERKPAANQEDPDVEQWLNEQNVQGGYTLVEPTAEEKAMAGGAEVVIVDAGGKELPKSVGKALPEKNKILLDANTGGKARMQALVGHELQHQWRRNATWQEMRDLIKGEDPDGFAFALRVAGLDQGEAGINVSPEVLEEDAVGKYLELLAGYLASEPEAAAGKLPYPILARVADAAVEMARKLKLPVRSREERILHREHAQRSLTEFEANQDPEKMRALATGLRSILSRAISGQAEAPREGVSPAVQEPEKTQGPPPPQEGIARLKARRKVEQVFGPEMPEAVEQSGLGRVEPPRKPSKLVAPPTTEAGWRKVEAKGRKLRQRIIRARARGDQAAENRLRLEWVRLPKRPKPTPAPAPTPPPRPAAEQGPPPITRIIPAPRGPKPKPVAPTAPANEPPQVTEAPVPAPMAKPSVSIESQTERMDRAIAATKSGFEKAKEQLAEVKAKKVSELHHLIGKFSRYKTKAAALKDMREAVSSYPDTISDLERRRDRVIERMKSGQLSPDDAIAEFESGLYAAKPYPTNRRQLPSGTVQYRFAGQGDRRYVVNMLRTDEPGAAYEVYLDQLKGAAESDPRVLDTFQTAVDDEITFKLERPFTLRLFTEDPAWGRELAQRWGASSREIAQPEPHLELTFGQRWVERPLDPGFAEANRVLAEVAQEYAGIFPDAADTVSHIDDLSGELPGNLAWVVRRYLQKTGQKPSEHLQRALDEITAARLKYDHPDLIPGSTGLESPEVLRALGAAREEVGGGEADLDALQGMFRFEHLTENLTDAFRDFVSDRAQGRFAAKPAPRIERAEPFAPNAAGNYQNAEWYTNAEDKYLYHITSPEAADAILDRGLMAGTGANWPGSEEHREWSTGRAFLTTAHNVAGWKNVIERKIGKEAVVLRVPRSDITAPLQSDTKGGRGDYFVDLEEGQALYAAKPAPAGTVERHQEIFAQESVERPAGERRPGERSLVATEVDPRVFLAATDEWRAELNKPYHISIADQTKRAETELAADYDGTKERILEHIRTKEGPVAPWQSRAMSRIIVDDVQRAMRTGNKADYIEALETSELYRTNQANVARGLSVNRDPFVTPLDLLAQLLMRHSPRVRRQLRRIEAELKQKGITAARSNQLKEKRRVIQHQEAERVLKARSALKKAGFDPANLPTDWTTNPVTFANIVRVISTAKATGWDKMTEWVISGMVSAPLTQKANILGNAAYIAWEGHIGRIAQALANTVVRDPESPTFGEVAAFYRATVPAFFRAVHYLKMAYRTELPMFELDLRRQGKGEAMYGTKVDALPGAMVGGKFGRVMRAPGVTSLLAFDQAMKAFAATMEVSALAYRQAKKEGAKGAAIETRMKELMADDSHPIYDKALLRARQQVFQEPSGPISEAINKGILYFRETLDTYGLFGFPFGTALLPFVTTPTAIFAAGLKVPFAPIQAIINFTTGRTRPNAEGVIDKPQLVQDIAGSALGMAVAWGILMMVLDDDDDGLPSITGSGGVEWGERRLQYRTVPPYSIRIGGTYFDYRRLEPAAVTLATLVDAGHAVRTMLGENPDAASEAMSKLFRSVMDQMSEKTFMRTIGDAYKAVMDRNSNEINAIRFAENAFGVSKLVPNIVKQPLRETDPYFRASQLRRYEDEPFWGIWARHLYQQAFPSAKTAPPPKVDLWGRPQTRFDPDRNGVSRYTMEIVNPAPPRDYAEKTADLDRLLLRWNDMVDAGEVEGRKYFPKPPDYWHRHKVGGQWQKVYWTNEEYEYLSRESGQRAARRLVRAGLNWKNPRARDIDHIEQVLRQTRAQVRNELYAKRKRAK